MVFESDEQFQGAIKEIMTSSSVKIRSEQIWTCSFAASNSAYICEVQLVCELEEMSKKGNRPSIGISLYLAGHIPSILVLLNTSSSSMSTFQNTEYMDARGSAFNVAGRDQINVVMGPNSLGAMQNHSCTNIYSFYVFLYYMTPDLKELLNPVPDAAYDSIGGVGGCLEGTRREVIGKIIEWIDGHNDQPICWLNGAAGFGKSAIS